MKLKKLKEKIKYNALGFAETSIILAAAGYTILEKACVLYTIYLLYKMVTQ